MQILVIGRPDQIFVGTDQIGQIEIYQDLQSGLEALADGHYEVVALQITGVEGRLGRLIGDIRQKTDARLILLARIYEEPVAIRYLARSGSQGADDYVLYPTSVQALIQPCHQWPAGPAPSSVGVVSEDVDVATRIRILERLATEDDLTGLKNRRYIWEFARQVIARSAYRQVRMTLLLFDIDDFKRYNDIHGHAAGDRILREIAALIRRCCRPHDVVGRLGGDEFAVIFWDEPGRPSKGRVPERRASTAAHPKEVMAIAKRFAEAISGFDWSSLGPKGKGTLAVSGGLASFPADGRTVEELFNKADAALMEAKRTGRNRILVVGEQVTG